MPIEITVIICTRNRASQLRQVLQSAAEMTIPQGLDWEFIVIDNGSTDNTAEVVGSFADRLPIRCVREDTAGLSNARNRGVVEAKGNYICWTDDDVEIDKAWLSAYYASFLRHPDAAVFGGRVIPKMLPPTPAWFDDMKTIWPVSSLLAYRNLSEVEIPLSFASGNTPYGANFAIRAKEQKSVLYDPDLGVSPNHKRVGEETEVIYKIFKTGAKGWWVPESKVNHIIPQGRQTLRYVYDYFYLVGETFAFMRDRYYDDNHLIANRKPDLYDAGRGHLFMKLCWKLAQLPVKLLYKKSSFVRGLAQVGYLAGAYSYKSK